MAVDFPGEECCEPFVWLWKAHQFECAELRTNLSHFVGQADNSVKFYKDGIVHISTPNKTGV
jgi:hypothetical protein